MATMRGAASKRLGTFVCSTCRSLNTRSQRRHASTSDIYDVVTVGGGPAGLALLAALKSSPKTRHLKTALIETQDLAKQTQWTLPSDQYSNRASSLTPFSVEFLEQSGSWNHVDQTRTQPYNAMQVWDAGNNASIQFDWKAEAQRYNSIPRTVATMAENANLTSGLLKHIESLNATDCLMSNTKVSSIEMGQDDPKGLDLSNWPLLSLQSSTGTQDGMQIAARLLVGADGINSPVRSFAGINTHGWDYDRHGVVATLKVEYPEYLEQAGSVVAYQRFLPQLGGPIAILPLPNGHASMVWSTTPAHAAYLKSLSTENFVTMVNAALRLNQTDLSFMLAMSPNAAGEHQREFDWRESSDEHQSRLPAPRITSVQDKTVASFPLRFRHATTLVGPRTALIGDAAHTVHPLAGQGLNLGLADAKSLAETIAYSVEHGMDVGDGMALERFSSDRFGKGLLMSGGVDALNWMYQLGTGEGIMSNVLSGARGLGMSFFGSTLAEQTGLKGRIMKAAEGS